MITSFKVLNELILENPDVIDVGSGASSELIKRSEDFLGVTFPESLVLYAKTWGTLAIGPFEYYGFIEGDFIESKVPDGVWFTARKRDVLGLPTNLFVIFNNEGDEFHCVDLGTEEIKAWDTSQRDVVAVKAANLFDYILEESADFI